MADLTPLDVHRKRGHFRRILRGYDPAEVDTFLGLVADRLNDLVRENLSLSEVADRFKRQVAAMEAREWAVQDALSTAQELRKEVNLQSRRQEEAFREQASREAALMKAEAEVEISRRLAEAEAMLRDRRTALEELERSRLRLLKSLRVLLQRELDGMDVEEARDPLQDIFLDLKLGGGMPAVERDGEAESVGAVPTEAWESAESGVAGTDIEPPEIHVDEGSEVASDEEAPGDEEVIVLGGHEGVTPNFDTMNAGAFDYLVKPIRTEALQDLLNRVLKDGQRNNEASSKEDHVGEGEQDEEALDGSET